MNESYPTPEGAVRTERMNSGFLKLHTDAGPVHIFTQPDLGDFHDHPWPFTTHVLEGGYIEEVATLRPDGQVEVETVHRLTGTTHRVQAGTVHRIVELPAGFCVTQVKPGLIERTAGFYRWDEAGIWHRPWHRETFELLAPRSEPG